MTPYFADDWLTIYQGDARDVLPTLPGDSVDCIVTSPPYWGLRDYGTASWSGGIEDCDHVEMAVGMSSRNTLGPNGHLPSTNAANVGRTRQYALTCGRCGATRQDSQLGLEATPEQYVANLVAVFRELRRVLKPSGTCWLNLGDSYSLNQRAGAPKTGSYAPERAGWSDVLHERKIAPGLKAKDLVGIPWRVAFALQADGWYLRSDIIWAKPNPMPESVTDRPTKAHEYLFLLTKSARYYYDADAVREAHQWPGGSVVPRGVQAFATAKAGPNGQPDRGNSGGFPITTEGRNLRSVWTIATRPYPGAHFAVFPPELPERCIKAGSPELTCADCGNIGGNASRHESLRGVRARLPDSSQPTESLLFQDLLQSGDISNESDHQGVRALGEGIHSPVPTDASDGDADRLRGRASTGDGRAAWTDAATNGSRGSHQRREGRQPTGQPESADQDSARRSVKSRSEADGPLSGMRPAFPAEGTCGQCGSDRTKPGLVLDCFAGSGTTGMVANRLSRRAILIDLNADYLRQQMARNAQTPLGLGA